MDLSTLALERIFGREPQKIVRICILRMWAGYAFDAGEFAFIWIYIGIAYINDIWRYVFYGYCAFLGFVAFWLTLIMIVCIIGADLRRSKAVPYIMAYVKLSSAVNAGFVFFQLWNSENRDVVVIVLMVFTALDMALDLIEMGLGFAGLDYEKLGKRQVQIEPIPEFIPPKKKY